MISDKLIVHIVTKEKFSVGYINFMKINMTDYTHIFLLSCAPNSKYREEDLIDNKDIYYYKSKYELLYSRTYKKILSSANKIIVTGLFGIEKVLFFWTKKYMNKTYIHLWGGDFYCLRNRPSNLNEYIEYHYRHSVLKKTYGIVFLIKEELDPFCSITSILPRIIFDAPMMENPLKENLLFSFDNKSTENDVKKIIVGNSADSTNNHLSAFGILKNIEMQDYKIICPLAYGDEEYSKKVIAIGKEYFGEKFFAQTKWCNKEDYYSFLKECDVGVFFNDRQQALGNIYALLYMGKKIFLRSDTSMYNYFINNGCIIFNELELNAINISSELTSDEKERNRDFIRKIYSQEYAINKWTSVLSS